MTTIQFDLNVPQSRFLQLPHKFKAYVAGFGSGKTFVGCAGICAHFWQWPGINQGYFAPTIRRFATFSIRRWKRWPTRWAYASR